MVPISFHLRGKQFDLAISSYMIVHDGVEYGHHPVQGERLGTRELGTSLLLGANQSLGLPLPPMVLHEKPAQNCKIKI